MWGKAVVLRPERSLALLALISFLMFCGPEALAQGGGRQTLSPPVEASGGGEYAPEKSSESAPSWENTRPAPPPEVGTPAPDADSARPPDEAKPEGPPAASQPTTTAGESPATPNAPTPNTTTPNMTTSGATAAAAAQQQPGVVVIGPVVPVSPCTRTITADVVAFDQVYTYNRFGAFNPGGMMYALKRDVVAIEGTTPGPGNAQLRHDKRPRPIVLRVNEGDCLKVTFFNWLTEKAEQVEDLKFNNQPDRQPYPPHFPVRLRQNNTTTTRTASMHVNGLDYVNGPNEDDGAFVGQNANSMAKPGETKVYTWFGAKQGQYLLFSMGAPSGNEGDNGQGGLGLFGSVNVEPKGAKWYRSQVTYDVLQRAYQRGPDGILLTNTDKTPRINYEAVYKETGDPVLNMLRGTEIIYTDLNAIITGFEEDCTKAPPSGTCGKPFREFSVLFHDELKAVQAFSKEDPDHPGNPLSPLDAEIFHGVRDGFGVNYGASGLGSILIANRKKVGPAAACEDCKFEDFFLTSWVNGDPALVIKRSPYQDVLPEVLFPDDPSNVHHSYLNDPVRFRNVHIGAETHVFHLHAHQWLQTPRHEDSTYLDSQTISPGASFTYEINYGGSGNRNITPGDAIFHCHLYPHFAQGMWELWRNHDVFEDGSPERRLPDAEVGWTPTPAIVPLPNLGMPPMPTAEFMGFPFYIGAPPGSTVGALPGKRPPQPPLDFDIDESGIIPVPRDGGLPRHIVLKAEILDGKRAIEKFSPALLEDVVAKRVLNTHIPDPEHDPELDFTNDTVLTAFARSLVSANLQLLPPGGTDSERVAMKFHSGCLNQPCSRAYPAYTPTGQLTKFEVNGLPPISGAPYADPCRDDEEGKVTRTIEYRAAYIQFEMIVNKEKWHDRQARIMTLEDDAIPTIEGERSPEPLYFRAKSGECIVFNATNLIPKDLNLDDFQIFTPTDTMGQHIHLVKFDVTSSDGAANGWNYEDGTFSPGEVQERIHANNKFQEANGGKQILTLQTNKKFGEGPDIDGNKMGDWIGAQTTIQRWWADPLLNTRDKDRTIRTVFTHDHFGPSSHQHHGFYGALVVEPPDTTKWTALDGSALGDGTPGNGREDGGPTSFAANIHVGKDGEKSFREFNLAFGDFAIVYRPPFEDPQPINPPGRKLVALPIAIERDLQFGPQPESISADDPGTQLVNYRNEPVPLRLRDSQTMQPFPDGRGDPANIFSSKVHGDPFTPILPAYEKDQTVIRLIQGAQEEQHVFNLHGYKWFFQPGTPEDPDSVNNSGYRNGQQIGISEHFEFYLNQPPAPDVPPPTSPYGESRPHLIRHRFVDHLYSSAATDNLWDGQWGILRVYNSWQTGGSGISSQTGGDQPALWQGEPITATEQQQIAEVDVANPSNPEGDTTIKLARLPNNPAPTGPPPEYQGTTTGGDETPTAGGSTTATTGGDEPTTSGPNIIDNPPPPPDDYEERIPPVCGPEVHRKFEVTAILARDLLPNKRVVYNKRSTLVDLNAILFVDNTQLEELKSGARENVEPLILRAAAGECIEVTLKSELPVDMPENNSWNLMPMIVEGFNFNQVRTSNRVGLHSQLVAVNTYLHDGANVGFNEDSTVGPGESKTYRWYAGDRYTYPDTGEVKHTPIEFGATGLRDMGDAIKHASHGAIGALIIEPYKSWWTVDEKSNASATVSHSTPSGDQTFREFVVLYQTDLSLLHPGFGECDEKHGGGELWEGRFRALCNMDNTNDPEDSGMKAFNYKTEPLWGRLGVPITTPPIGGPDHPGPSINDFDLTNILSSTAHNPGCKDPNGITTGCGDPETPVFSAHDGQKVRWRVLDVAGHPRQHGFTIHGHNWQFEPWQNHSRIQGFNPFTFDIGSESGIGPTRHVNILTQAGGRFGRPKDYLYRTQESFQFTYGGLWGIFRVTPSYEVEETKCMAPCTCDAEGNCTCPCD